MQIQLFQFREEDHIENLTTVDIDGDPWFVASDVCNLLEIQNVTQALKSLDDDEKLPYVIHRAGQDRKVNLISESGLYAMVFQSRKPNARQFRKWVTTVVIPSIRKTGAYGIDRKATPNFVVRFNSNWDRTSRGHFSVISELFIRLYGRFEQVGYQIPNRAMDEREIRADVSVGRLFSKHLTEKYPEIADDFTTYLHVFPDGLEVAARQYPNTHLPIFINFLDAVWIPEHAHRYFGERDLKALDYLPKLLPPTS